MRRTLSIVTCLSVALFIGGAAEAKTHRDLTYRFNQIWSSAVRFLRVDNGFPIAEQDKKSGYILFEYRDVGRTMSGSLEIVRVAREGNQYVRADLRIPQMPSYVEVVLLDKLLRKLRDEHGDPPPPQPVVAPAPQPATDGDKAGKAGKGKAGKDDATTETEPPEDEEDLEVDEKDLEHAAEEGAE